MFEHRYPPRRPAAAATSAYKKPLDPSTPEPSELSLTMRRDERVRLTRKGARLLQDHLARTQRQGRR